MREHSHGSDPRTDAASERAGFILYEFSSFVKRALLSGSGQSPFSFSRKEENVQEWLEIRDEYLRQERTAKVALLLGYITEGEYQEALERRQLAEAALQEVLEWQRAWLNSLREEE